MASGTKRERVIQRVIGALCDAGEPELAWTVVHEASRRYPILEKMFTETMIAANAAAKEAPLRRGRRS